MDPYTTLTREKALAKYYGKIVEVHYFEHNLPQIFVGRLGETDPLASGRVTLTALTEEELKKITKVDKEFPVQVDPLVAEMSLLYHNIGLVFLLKNLPNQTTKIDN